MKRELARKGFFPSITRWNPFDEIRDTQDFLNNMFRGLVPGFELAGGKTLAPFVDVKEEDDKVVVTMDIPGVDKKDVDIHINDNLVEISARCSRESETEEEGYVQRERTYSSFSRTVSLPSNVTEEGAKAKLEDGVLTVTLPKAEVEERPRIEIE